MTAQEGATEEGPPVTPTEEAPEAPPAEKPLFDLNELIKGRRKGEGLGVAEAILLMDFQDRRAEREYRRELAEERRQGSRNSSPEVDALKTDIKTLTSTVNTLVESMKTKEQEDAQKAFASGVAKEITDKIMPELNSLAQRVEAIEAKAPAGSATEEEASGIGSEVKELKETLRNFIDKVGETAGAKGMTLSDVNAVLDVVERLEKRAGKKGEEGEVDYKTMAISTVGEISKELITAYKEISTSTPQTAGTAEPTKPETPATTMQTIIKRQVQNYITQRMKAGAVTLNPQEAAREIGITPGQVVWAYQTLVEEGWLSARVPAKSRRKTGREPTQPPTGEETEIPTEGEGEGTEDQVFEPPTET